VAQKNRSAPAPMKLIAMCGPMMISRAAWRIQLSPSRISSINNPQLMRAVALQTAGTRSGKPPSLCVRF
jgi:hypothetical protein